MTINVSLYGLSVVGSCLLILGGFIQTVRYRQEGMFDFPVGGPLTMLAGAGLLAGLLLGGWLR